MHPSTSQTELIGTFECERIVRGEGEGRWIIGVLEDGMEVLGNVAEGKLRKGKNYRFFGRLAEKPAKYQGRPFCFRNGRWNGKKIVNGHGKEVQFKFTSVSECLPITEKGIVAYLTRAKGFGPRRAAQAWSEFGQDVMRVLKESPETVVAKVRGLSLEDATEAAAYFKSIEGIERVAIELGELLDGRGFPKGTPGKLIDEFGARAAEVVRENPYVLLDRKRFPGCAFSKVDKLYLELGYEKGALIRQAYCIWDRVHRGDDGSTWVAVGVAAGALGDLRGAEARPRQALELAGENGLLVYWKDRAGKVWVAETGKAAAEGRLADWVVEVEEEREQED